MTEIKMPTLITYSDGCTPVRLGDWVKLRVLFRRRVGRVAYVPGVSTPHEEFEFGGLTWVGIDIPRGPVVKALVDPETRSLRKNIDFIRHDTEGAKGLDPLIELT